MISIETLSIVFTGLSISLAAFYYISTLRNANRMRELTLESQELTRKAQEQALETRQAQLLMQINNHLNEMKFQNYLVELRQWQGKDIEELMEKYGSPDNIAKMNYVTSFFEGVATLVRKKFLNQELVYEVMALYLFNYWGRISPHLEEWRVRSNRPKLWRNTEYLYQLMMKMYEEEYGHEYSSEPLLDR